VIEKVPPSKPKVGMIHPEMAAAPNLFKVEVSTERFAPWPNLLYQLALMTCGRPTPANSKPSSIHSPGRVTTTRPDTGGSPDPPLSGLIDSSLKLTDCLARAPAESVVLEALAKSCVNSARNILQIRACAGLSPKSDAKLSL